MNVAGPGSSGGLTGLDARALRLLAETLIAETAIEGAAREPSRADDPRASAPVDHLTVSFDALTAAPLQHLLQMVEQQLFPPSATTLQDVSTAAMTDAKDVAQKAVDRAAQAIDQGGVHGPHIPENLDPQTVLALATRMIETQQYPNYLRATELSNTIVTWYEGPLPDMPVTRSIAIGGAEKIRSARPAVATSHQLTQATAKLWRRAPVLVLLLGWLLAGSVVAIVARESSPLLTTWALGFPALVALQFILTIRGVWRRK